MPRTVLGLAITAAILAILYPDLAHAYLDPGTGSYLVQIIIAGLLGAAFAIKVFWMRIKEFFLRMFSRGAKND